MLMQMAIALTVASLVIEWTLYYNFPRLLAFTHGKTYRDILFSFALSAAIGAVFSGEGVVVLIAASLSTAISPAGMPLIRMLHRNRHQFPVWKAKAEIWFEQTIQVLRDLFLFIFAILRIITLPVRWSLYLMNHPTTRKVLTHVGNRT